MWNAGSALLRSVLGASGRACVVLFGTTITAWYLLNRIDGRVGQPLLGDGEPSNPWSRYWWSFGDALQPSAEVSGALGRTLLLAAVGITFGLLFGALIGLAMRVGSLRPAVGFLTVPAIAVTIPGVALYPLASAANSWGWADSGPVDLGTSFGEGLTFISLWGLLVGLAVAPSIAAGFGRTAAGTALGPAIARNWSLVRAEPGLGSRFGMPTTALVSGLAVAEVLSGYDGAFATLFDALGRLQLNQVFQLIFWLAVGGAALVGAIHLAARLGADELRNPPTSQRESAALDAGPATTGRPRLIPATGVDRPLVMAMTLLLTLAAGVAVAGWLADPTGRDAGAVLVEPTAGGPWLGTDQVGRGLAHLTAVGLWPAMVAAVVPALIATVIGLLLTGLGAVAGSTATRTINTLIDLLWWPTPAVLPVAYLAIGSASRSGLNLGLLVTTGLALSPMAYRVANRTVAIGTGRATSQAASLLTFCAAVGLSLHVVLGFVGFGGSNERPQLGTVIRAGLETYDSSIWPYLVPTSAACILAWALYTMAAALVAPVEAVTPAPVATLPGLATPPGVGTPPGVATPPDGPAAAATYPTNPPSPPAVRADGETKAEPAPSHLRSGEPAIDTEVVSGAEPTPATELTATGPTEPDEPRPEPEPDEPRPEPESAELEPEPGPDSDESESDDDVLDLDDLPPILQQATRTVELRPSRLREAGIGARSATTDPTPLTDGWSKPVLAARPTAPTDPESAESESTEAESTESESAESQPAETESAEGEPGEATDDADSDEL